MVVGCIPNYSVLINMKDSSINGGVYIDSSSAITKAGGTINPGRLSSTRGDMDSAAVYVGFTDSPICLEHDMGATHNLIKTITASLTARKGWTR
jgi:hypothetical protein